VRASIDADLDAQAIAADEPARWMQHIDVTGARAFGKERALYTERAFVAPPRE
jgi:hypothetical protein